MDMLIGIGIGFVVGWVVFKRPEWATKLIDWSKGKIGWA